MTVGDVLITLLVMLSLGGLYFFISFLIDVAFARSVVLIMTIVYLIFRARNDWIPYTDAILTYKLW